MGGQYQIRGSHHRSQVRRPRTGCYDANEKETFSEEEAQEEGGEAEEEEQEDEPAPALAANAPDNENDDGPIFGERSYTTINDDARLNNKFKPSLKFMNSMGMNILQFVLAFLPMVFLEEVVIPSMNEYGATQLHPWTNVTKAELLRFIGINMYMTLVSMPTREHYWSKEPPVPFPTANLGQYMSRDRYKQLLATLVIGMSLVTAGADPHIAIRIMQDAFNAHMKTVIELG